MKSNVRIVLLVFLGFMVMFLVIGAQVIKNDTIISWWEPLGAALIPAVIAAMLTGRHWDKLTGASWKWVNYAVCILVTGSVFYFAFLGANRWYADEATDHEVTVTVDRKYTTSHTRYKRVSRRVRRPDGTYSTYHVDVLMPDSTVKSVETTRNIYTRVRTGSKATFHVRTGLFGYPVITSHGRLDPH